MPKITKYNGGYVIISLNDEDIYEKIERNLYKPILLTDIVINGIEKNDVFTTAYVEGTNIVFKDIYDKDITITQDNKVSIGDNGNHLYKHIFNYSDTYIAYINNIPYDELNEYILLWDGVTQGNVEKIKKIYNVFKSKTNYFPCASTSDISPIKISFYRSGTNLYLEIDTISLIINENGTATGSQGETINYICEKIF